MTSRSAETLRRLERARRQGDHRAVVAIATAALASNAEWTRMALEAAQAERRAGHVRAARVWVARARVTKPDTAETHLIELEHAWLGIIDALTFDAAVDCADRVLLALETDGRHAPEIRWSATRVLLSAASYHALTPERTRAVRRTLRGQQRALAEAGLTELAHDVARERAAGVPPRRRAAAWEAVARLGERDALPATAALATLRLASEARSEDRETSSVIELIDAAQRAYEVAGHRTGLLEVERERVLLAIERDGAPIGRLESVVDDLVEAGEPIVALLCLADLALRAQERGERALSLRAHERQRALTGTHGLLLLEVAARLTGVDLAMRRRDDALARDLCDEALALDLPPGLRASFLAQRGSAYAFAGEREKAIADRSEAIATFLSTGAEKAASDIVASLVYDIAGTRDTRDLKAADDLLLEWERQDLERGDRVAALRRGLQRSDLRALEVMSTHRAGESLDTRESALIEEALTLNDDVDRRSREGAFGSLTRRERARLRAEIDQWRSNLLSLRGDVAGMNRALERAATAYTEAALPFHAANCRYVLGCSALNLANAENAPRRALAQAETAQTELRAALAYYDDIAGMRVNAAGARRHLAMLYLNLRHRLPPEARPHFLNEAEAHLEAAASDLEAVRRDYSGATRLDGLETKAKRAAEAMAVDAQALRLHLDARPDPSRAWQWATRAKARALVDLLGPGVEVPPKLAAVAAGDAGLAALIDQERALLATLAACPASDRRAVAADLAAVRQAMGHRPELAEYLLRRTGGAPLPDDLDRIGERAPADVALVDWVAVGDALHLMVARPGEAPRSVRLAGTLSAARELIHHSFGTSDDTRRALTSGARQLAELGALVAPLARLTRAGEHLILCPTGVLHGAPLQLLEVEGRSLLERNPLARTPSLGLLRIACERAPGTRRGQVEIFGDPSSDRPDARGAAEHVAAALERVPHLGTEATAETFEQALASASLVLYQGHAKHLAGDALGSYFQLAGDACLDVRRLLELPSVTCRTMVIGACEAGRSDYRTGDEPLGLLAALLVVGVASVTAADWAVHAGSARALMAPYTVRLLEGDRPIDALQATALALREDPRYRAPYHWGAFAVHGDPWRAVVPPEEQT